MGQPSKEEVRSILRPHHQRIRGVFEKAWAEWKLLEGLRSENALDPVLYSRTIANYVFDAIARIAISEFAADKAIQVRLESQTVKFAFEGKVLARFKKGDQNGLGQNNPTQASLSFTEAEALLPGMPPETAKVEFIWIPNSIMTQIASIQVIARDGSKILWGYPIRSEEVSAVLQFPARQASDDTNTDETSDLVRPKKSTAKKSNDQA